MKTKFLIIALFIGFTTNAQEKHQSNAFTQLGTMLRSPNAFRNASGRPGYKYWQQKADYQIAVSLNDDKQTLHGEETITYYNNSPDALPYLWIQLDQNIREKNSITYQTRTSSISDKMSFGTFNYYLSPQKFDGGFKIQEVKDAQGNKLPYTINYTMMRIDLPKPLKSGEKFVFSIKWWYNINNRLKIRGRGGYEHFNKDGNNLYTIAQFYPRMAVYSDFEGWQNKQYIGIGEFALTFGDFDVKINVPADFVVAATGELKNKNEVLSETELKRFEKAQNTFDKPVIIVTEAEARKKELQHSKQTKTWHFKAQNVRDFAFAGSRKFIWDAMGVKFGNRTVMAMSFYPKEGNPLWEKYSTRVVAHTLKVYSAHTFNYPYPVAQSIHTAKMGMEYPMICFNGGRPEPDGTYSERTKKGMIGVIIHEVGHNFFPMIVNSDERQWTWMDEGLNTFLQGIAEREWDRNWTDFRGNPRQIVDYMRTAPSKIEPIMITSEAIKNRHGNAYSKPAAALNILRETVMGRELFDFAFKQYAQTWMFKHPTPDDFFRIMEDASAVDLDWFWRAWFFGTDHVDIAIVSVKNYQPNTQNPEIEKKIQKKQADGELLYIQYYRDKNKKTKVEQEPDLKDFYNSYNPYAVTKSDKQNYQAYLKKLSNKQKQLINSKNYYTEIKFKNIGGIVMPLILRFTFQDQTTQEIRISVEIWRKNNWEISKVFVTGKKIVKVQLDPYRETVDTDMSNNVFPPQISYSRFELYQQKIRKSTNPMQNHK